MHYCRNVYYLRITHNNYDPTHTGPRFNHPSKHLYQRKIYPKMRTEYQRYGVHKASCDSCFDSTFVRQALCITHIEANWRIYASAESAIIDQFLVLVCIPNFQSNSFGPWWIIDFIANNRTKQLISWDVSCQPAWKLYYIQWIRSIK